MPISDFILKDAKKEARLINKKIALLMVIILLLFSMLIARLIYLQFFMHRHFSTLSHHNRIKVLPVPPIRGRIFSADGVLLAKNQPSFSLEIIPEATEDIDAAISELKKLITISEHDQEKFKALLKRKKPHQRVLLRSRLNEMEVAAFMINRYRFHGANISVRLGRHYPLADTFAHVVGYVSRIDEDDIKRLDQSNYKGTAYIGKLGIEKAYENSLHGIVGHQQVEVNARGRIVRVLDRVAATAGADLQLTLHASLQQVAAKALQGLAGAVVAVDPYTGAVLAAVSAPSYDPNLFATGINNKQYQRLLLSKKTPLINRITQGQYPPGSTVKPFFGLLALELGIRSESDQAHCPGWYSLTAHGHVYRDWERHDAVDLSAAIAKSCNVYFYELANDLGPEQMQHWLQQFGFGAPTGVAIGNESGGLLPSRAWKQQQRKEPWFPGETLLFGIGQGYLLATPIQLAMAAAALANGGALLQPRLVSWSQDIASGKKVYLDPVYKGKIAVERKQHWQTIIQSMHDVVHSIEGTAWRSGLGAEYTFAGKTGTAQIVRMLDDKTYDIDTLPKAQRNHALFIAFAPIERPTIAVAIIVENGGSGSSAAAPIARRLFDHYLVERHAH